MQRAPLLSPLIDAGPYFFDAQSATFGPDAHTVLVSGNRDGDGDILTLDLRSGRLTPLRLQPRGARSASWSQTAHRVLYLSAAGGSFFQSDLYTADINGEDSRKVDVGDLHVGFAGWSPDGRRIVFNTTGMSGSRQIFVVDVDGKTSPNSHRM